MIHTDGRPTIAWSDPPPAAELRPAWPPGVAAQIDAELGEGAAAELADLGREILALAAGDVVR